MLVIDHHVDDTVDSGLTKIDRKFSLHFFFSSSHSTTCRSSYAIILILDFRDFCVVFSRHFSVFVDCDEQLHVASNVSQIVMNIT